MTMQHTPYDATITTSAKHLGLGANDVINRNIEQDYLLACARAEGYLCCVADYAPFLEAAKAVLERLPVESTSPEYNRRVDALRAAIAAVERGNT